MMSFSLIRKNFEVRPNYLTVTLYENEKHFLLLNSFLNAIQIRKKSVQVLNFGNDAYLQSRF